MRANKIEKEVSGCSGGRAAATTAKAWLSVTTRRGGRARLARAAGSSVSRVTRAMQPRSRASRRVSACGRMRRPLGAAVSIGVTRSTTSPAATKPSSGEASTTAASWPLAANVIRRSRSAWPAPCARQSRQSGAASVPSSASQRALARCRPWSAWVTTTRRGLLAVARPCQAAVSAGAGGRWAGVTRMAKSVQDRRSRLRATRCSPRLPESSKPAVSQTATAPSAPSSMGITTGSVVVPAWGETMATVRPAMALIRLLPPLHGGRRVAPCQI